MWSLEEKNRDCVIDMLNQVKNILHSKLPLTEDAFAVVLVIFVDIMYI